MEIGQYRRKPALQGVELSQIDDEDKPQQQRTGRAARLEDTADRAAPVLLICREGGSVANLRQSRVDATKQSPDAATIRAGAYEKIERLWQSKEQNHAQ